MKPSSTQEFLRGRELPEVGRIKEVLIFGQRRILVGEEGRRTISKAALTRRFNEELSKDQKAAMLKTMRRHADGKVSVKIGGTEQGERHTYASKAGAMQALKSHYGH